MSKHKIEKVRPIWVGISSLTSLFNNAIDIAKEIKKIGSYEVKVNLHAEVQAKIHIEVVKEEDKT